MIFNKMLMVMGLMIATSAKPPIEYLFAPIAGYHRNKISDWEILHPSADATASRGILFDETVDRHLSKQEGANPLAKGVFQSQEKYCSDLGKREEAFWIFFKSVKSRPDKSEQDKAEQSSNQYDEGGASAVQ